MATVLITGCDTGLGVEFARQYAANGYRVIACCLDPPSANEAAAIHGNIELVKLMSPTMALSKRLQSAWRARRSISCSTMPEYAARIRRSDRPITAIGAGSWKRILLGR